MIRLSAAGRGRATPLLAGLVLVLAAAALLTIGDTLRWTWRAWSPVPWWDQWETVGEYIRFKTEGAWWREWVRPHNEHRLVLPRLFFLADYEWFGAANILLVPLCVIIQATHAGLLLLLGRAATPRRDSWLYAAAAPCAAAMFFSLGQMENVFWGFQIAFAAVFAAATGSFYLLARAHQRYGERLSWVPSFAGGLALIGVATLNMANGVVAGGVAVAMLAVLRANWRLTLGAALATALCALVFFADYANTAGGSGGGLDDLIADPWLAFRYIATFVGGVASPAFMNAPFAPWRELLCMALGAFGMALSILAAVRVLLGRERDPYRMALIAIMVFVGASAVATASGRMTFYGVSQALSSRYGTPSAMFWAAQLFYWLSVFAQSRRPRLAGIVVACGAAMLLGLLAGQRAIKPLIIDWIAKVDWGADALLSDVPDPEALGGIAVVPSVALERAAYLKRWNLSVYGRPEARWLGRPLSEVAPQTGKDACMGVIDLIANGPELTEDGLRASGWAWNLRDGRAADRILITGPDLRVRGFGTAGVRRPDVHEHFPVVKTGQPGWRALARGRNGEALHAFAVLPDGRSCLLGSRRIEGLTPQTALGPPPRDRMGPIIMAAAAGEGIFLADAYPPLAGRPNDPAYASWAGNDANTGAIAFGPFKPSGKAISFDLVTGASPGRQRVQVVDAQTGEVLREVSPRMRLEWSAATLPVEPGREIRLLARDSGSGWGEWIGITTPRDVAP